MHFEPPGYLDQEYDGPPPDYDYSPIPDVAPAAGAGWQQGGKSRQKKRDDWQPGKKGQGGKGFRRENEVGGVIEPRRPVPTLAKRLLKLLLAHPELVDSMGDQQLEVLDHGPHLGMVRELVVLAQRSGARHLGALLEAAEPDSDVELVLRSMSADLVGQDDLPEPQAEWDDALNRIEFDSVRAEMTALANRGLQGEGDRERYEELNLRFAALKRAGLA